MKQLFFFILIAGISLAGCSKMGSTPGPTPDPTPPVTPPVTPTPAGCKLTLHNISTGAPVFYEYNDKGKLSKTRWFPNGPYAPVTRVYEYGSDNTLTKVRDSSGNANTYVQFSGNSGIGPTKAVDFSDGKKNLEIEFFYDLALKVVNKKVFTYYDLNEQPLPKKDTMNFYYNLSTGNVIKETVVTNYNGTRREYILLEAEGYDNKTSFYKSLGIEYSLLYRWGRNGEGPYNHGDYIFSPCANNPGKVYLHNQGIEDANKGDYLTYSYEYDSNGFPTKISHTYTNPSTTSGPVLSNVRFECK